MDHYYPLASIISGSYHSFCYHQPWQTEDAFSELLSSAGAPSQGHPCGLDKQVSSGPLTGQSQLWVLSLT